MGKVLSTLFFHEPEIELNTRRTIASFPGGKSGRKHLPLYSYVPSKIDRLIEPFAGLANFFFVISKRVSKVWLNDKDPYVYSLLTSIKEQKYLEELISRIQEIYPVRKDDYYKWKQKKPEELIEKAVKLLIILNCSTNGAGGGYSKEKAFRKWYENKPRIWVQLTKKLRKATITNWDYKEVIRYIQEKPFSNDFIYLDPPYFKVAEKGRLYHNYNSIDWKVLGKELKQTKGHWLMSNRDCPEMRIAFNKFFQFSYNTYNDMNNKKNGNPELLISNYPFKST